MYKALNLLVAALGLSLMLGCVAPGALAGPTEPELNPLGSIVLGMNSSEIGNRFGKPAEEVEGGCAIPLELPDGDAEVLVPGTVWVYTYEVPNKQKQMLSICMVNGLAVGQQISVEYVTGGRITSLVGEVVDFDLLKKALNGSDKEKTPKDVEKPKGPQLEI